MWIKCHFLNKTTLKDGAVIHKEVKINVNRIEYYCDNHIRLIDGYLDVQESMEEIDTMIVLEESYDRMRRV